MICLFLLALLPFKGHAQEGTLPPVQNVRVENGLIIWDEQTEIQTIIGNRRLVFNIYRVFPASTRNIASYIATISNNREFRPSVEGDYVVIASDSSSRFSRIDEATVVRFFTEAINLTGIVRQSSYEVRTNRCTDVNAGQSCIVACGFGLPTGGACRADGPTVLHARARNNGYECIATADTQFVETDVFCHR